jgi:ParB family chromosome partitioning protein
MSILISSITVPEHRQRREIGDINELADSISRLGLIHPVVVDRNNCLIAGFRRFSAVKALGWTHIDCTYTDELDPLVLHLIELEENIKRKDLTWQERHDAIIEYHRIRKEQDPNWTEARTASAIGIARPTVTQHTTVDKLRDNPLVRNADGFRTALNNATRILERRAADEANTHGLIGNQYTSPFIHADFHAWSETYNGPKFNLIHCDFPYGINSHNSRQNPSGYDDSIETYFNLIRTLSINLDRFCAPSAHIIFWFSPTYFCQTWELLKLLDGFKFDEHPLIWARDDQRGIAPDAQRRPRRVYETAFFGWRGDRPLVRMKNNAFVGPSPSGDHAHEKSQSMLEYFFEMVVDPQTAILDPTCGSGSAIRAATALGAGRTLGLEVNKEFINDARRTYDNWNRGRRNGNNAVATGN